MANEGMQTSESGLKFIANWEGMILHPYLDVAQKWTIGIGKLILPTDSFSTINNQEIKELLKSKDKNNPIAKKEIPEAEAFKLLKDEVKKCEDALKRQVKVPLTQNQFDALVSWSFNCGVGVFQTSTLVKELNRGNYDKVPSELLRWCKIKVGGAVKTNQGLMNRRQSEGELWSKSGTKNKNIV